jgi:hypothetical protein
MMLIILFSRSEVKELGASEEIMKLLECPICQGVPSPPIWTCMKGHCVCDPCRSHIDQCGLCRMPFTGARNLFMESVLMGCTLSCPYVEDGCEVVLKAEEMKIHAAECRFG